MSKTPIIIESSEEEEVDDDVRLMSNDNFSDLEEDIEVETDNDTDFEPSEEEGTQEEGLIDVDEEESNEEMAEIMRNAAEVNLEDAAFEETVDIDPSDDNPLQPQLAEADPQRETEERMALNVAQVRTSELVTRLCADIINRQRHP